MGCWGKGGLKYAEGFHLGLGFGLKKWPSVKASYRDTIRAIIPRMCSRDSERRPVKIENEYLYHWN